MQEWTGVEGVDHHVLREVGGADFETSETRQRPSAIANRSLEDQK